MTSAIPLVDKIAKEILFATAMRNCEIIGKPFSPDQYTEYDMLVAVQHAAIAVKVIDEVRNSNSQLSTERSACREDAESSREA